jgi:hypothetical protein
MASSTTTQEAATEGITQPYKFLDYYRKNDRQLFFGRERETEILVSDIVTARLVILFAKTGSGKSSLINAGVRPRLEDLDYHTFWIRVEQDPTEAARAAFRRENFSFDQKKQFVECLKEIVKQLDKPVVLFFDQFEEFFLFPTSLEPEAVRRFKLAAQRFVADVGKLYRDRESGVHMVFSLREEFFHEMDVFRSEIPTIFGAESSLRLRWLDDDQARRAITLPAQAAGVSFSEEFISALIEDLKDSEREGIEPARLQIVCDTIWARKCFDLEAYRALGRAKGILDCRLENDIATNLTDDELGAFEKLLPELTHSERQTKRVRAVDGIEQSLKIPPGSLDAVIAKLEELRLVVKSKHSAGVFIEWTSDYVAGRARRLKDHVRETLLKRLLPKIRDNAEAKMQDFGDSAQPRGLSTVERGAEDEFETLSMARRLVRELGAIGNGSTQTRALELLKLAMEQRDLANDALETAVQIGSEGAVQLLADALTRDDTAAKSIALLRQLKTSPAIRLLAQTVDVLGPFSLEAGMALSRIANNPDLERAREAKQALAALLAKRGEDLFRLALEKGIDHDMQFWLQKVEESGVPVWQILRNLLSDQKTPEALAQNIARLLSQIKDPRAEELTALLRAGQGQMKPIVIEQAPLPDFDEKTWERIVKRIRDDKCTPIIGPDASAGTLPLMTEIARHLALEFEYPFGDSDNLARVAQYVAATTDTMLPKEKVSTILLRSQETSENRSEAYDILARLPFAVYVTMSYDTLLAEALKRAGRDVHEALLFWNRHIPENSPRFDPDFAYSVVNPLVIYLFGRVDRPESMVLTEDDHFQFVVNVCRDYVRTIPHRLERALGGAMMFVGVNPLSVTARLLFSIFGEKLRDSGNTHVMQVMPTDRSQIEVKYLTSYLGDKQIKTCFETSEEFLIDLQTRWRQFAELS